MSKERSQETIATSERHKREKEFFRSLYHIHVNQETQDRIEELRRLLKQPEQEKLSLIMVFNHLAFSDPVMACLIAEEIDPARSRPRILPRSAWASRLDPRNAPLLLTIAASKAVGITTVPIVQAYQVNNPRYGYTESDAVGSYLRFFKTLKGMHDEGPLMLIVSPEGHRSETGALQEAVSEGTVRLGNSLLPVAFLPVAIEYPQGYGRNSLNIGRHVKLSVGNWFIQTAKDNGPTIIMLMDNLADELPPELRGPWGSDFTPPEASGR